MSKGNIVRSIFIPYQYIFCALDMGFCNLLKFTVYNVEIPIHMSNSRVYTGKRPRSLSSFDQKYSVV